MSWSGNSSERRPGSRIDPASVILGVWDGHDSGAAIIAGGRLVAAVNEERLTRRKLDIRFPSAAIACCLQEARLDPSDVGLVAVSTSDLAKTLGRWAPWTKERYYQVRRRLRDPGPLASLTRAAKYALTPIGPSALTRSLSRAAIARELARVEISTAQIRLYDHHDCHAMAAALSSGLDACAVVTIDGLGDGVSSTVSRFDGRSLTRIAATPAAQSLGVFFEHVTTLLNMRELEDEGKVMALADYAAPIPDAENPMMRLAWTEGLRIRTAPSLRSRLERILWRYPSEQFANMAQRTVERVVTELAAASCRETGLRHLALSGGIASNVKANRRVRLLDGVDGVFVFPHMGDGGLAVGAACAALADLASAAGAPLPRIHLDSLALGPDQEERDMRQALEAAGLAFQRPASASGDVADLLADGKVVLWSEGRMEFGPRALGHRSVLARPDRPDLRDRLNLVLKRRVWYQPFCPSILELDARQCFADWHGAPDRYMTMTYAVRPERLEGLSGVTGIDGTSRPQMVADDDPSEFASLLKAMRQRTGLGAVLNTSLNLHGEPMACTPADAVSVFVRSGADALRLGPFLTVRPASHA